MKNCHASPRALELEVIALFLGLITSLSGVCPWAAVDFDATSNGATCYRDIDLPSQHRPTYLPAPVETSVQEKGGVPMEPYNFFVLVVLLTTWLG
jgi:hypothetical protein